MRDIFADGNLRYCNVMLSGATLPAQSESCGVVLIPCTRGFTRKAFRLLYMWAAGRSPVIIRCACVYNAKRVGGSAVASAWSSNPSTTGFA